jgi:hypothetical protein
MALTKVFTFPNSERAQQFAGWLFLAGDIERVVEENTIMVEVATGKRTVINQGGRRPRRPPHVARARLKSAPAASLARRGGDARSRTGALRVSAVLREPINMALSGVPTLR